MATLPLPGTPCTVRIHPAVVLAMCDAFVRRDLGVDRVIGALLGSRSSDGASARVTASYAVPCHDRDGEMFVDVEFHKSMLVLHAKCAPEERPIGWFVVGGDDVAARALVHEFFAKETPGGAPLCVVLNPDFVHGGDSSRIIACDVGETVLATTDSVTGETRAAGVRFSRCACDVDVHLASKIGLAHVTERAKVKESDDIDGLRTTIAKLSTVLTNAQTYADASASGAPADVAVGRELSDALRDVPELTQGQLSKVFGDSMEDVKMVQYLNNLTKLQLTLAEKLHTTSLLA